MELKRLGTQQDFDSITPSDILIFRCTEYGADHWTGSRLIARAGCYKHGSNNELIFNKQKNWYLNIDRYLVGKSFVATDVYILQTDD